MDACWFQAREKGGYSPCFSDGRDAAGPLYGRREAEEASERKGLRGEEKGSPLSPRPHPLAHPPWAFMQSETRLRTYIGVWEPISRTGKELFRALSDSPLPDTSVMPIRRRSLSTVWSNLPVAPTGRRASPGYVAPIAAIRTSGHFRVRFSTSVPRATRNEPYSMLNTWPRICFLICPTANSCLRYQRCCVHTSKPISVCSARYPG